MSVIANLAELREMLPIKWSSLKPNPLHHLLYHSDCDGDITWRRCKKIADELTRLMDVIPADLDGGGHIGNFREKTQTFIDGCSV